MINKPEIFKAIDGGVQEVKNFLAEHPEVDVNSTNYGEEFKQLSCLTPLGYACQGKDTEVVTYLISVGAKVNLEKYLSTFLIACSHGALEIAKVLHAAGANVYEKDEYGQGAVHNATRCVCYPEIVRWLINDLKLPSDEKTLEGKFTPLMYAADSFFSEKDALECVNILMEAGADIHAVDANDTTVLMRAAGHGWDSVVEKLLKAGADPSARDIFGRTALSCYKYECLSTDKKTPKLLRSAIAKRARAAKKAAKA